MQATEATIESKSFIQEMDSFLKDLESWKSKRAVKQDAELSEEVKVPVEEDEIDTLKRIEEQFMQKANDREKEILDRLKAINIDPT